MQQEGIISAESLRHDQSLIRSAWRDVFSDPLASVQSLRDQAKRKGGLAAGSSTVSKTPSTVVLRSVYWRIYHDLLPDPTSFRLFEDHCKAQRDAYDASRRQYLIAPDGRWAADCSSDPNDPRSTTAGTTQSHTAAKAWDPLNLEGENPWKVWFAAQDLRATIRQDVERTFPDLPYFTIPEVQTSLTTILFLYSVLNPDVGYRQGMHELLAVILMIIDLDSLPPLPASSNFVDPITRQAPELVRERAMHATLSRDHVEHDAYTLFASLMKAGKSWYEWRAEEGPRLIGRPATQAPIIKLCNHMQGEVLRRVDPQLWERFETESVEAQIWGIRWIRLILSRELSFGDAMQMWDGIFADDPKLGLIEYVCVAMLLRIRNELLDADYPTLLTNLLRYPGSTPEYPLSPSLLLSQAIMLRSNVSPTAGVQAVLENHEILGIKPALDEEEKRASPPKRPTSTRRRGRGGTGSGFANRAPPGVQGLAQGLFERAQAAGLDKAFMSTVADLRRNLAELPSPTATAYSYIPSITNTFSPLHSPGLQADAKFPFSSIPSSSSPLPSHRFATAQQHTPILDRQQVTRSLRDVERELAELRLAMLGMGKAIGGWLDVLDGEDETSRRAARAGLERLKESLLNVASVDTADVVHEWGWSEALETPPSRNEPSPQPDFGLSESLATPPASPSEAPSSTPPARQSLAEHTPAATLPEAGPRQQQRQRPTETQIISSPTPTQAASRQQLLDPLSDIDVQPKIGARRPTTDRPRKGLQSNQAGAARGVDPLLGVNV